jgi:hypothetical protein
VRNASPTDFFLFFTFDLLLNFLKIFKMFLQGKISKFIQTLELQGFMCKITFILLVVTRECVLFIGTRFSNLYTAVDTPDYYPFTHI